MDTRCLPPNLQDGNLGREPYLRGSAGPPVKEEGFRVTGVGAPISGRRQAVGPALAPVFEGQGWLPGTIFPTEVYEAKGPRPEWRAGKSKTPRGHRLLRLRGERSCPLRNPARLPHRTRRPEEAGPRGAQCACARRFRGVASDLLAEPHVGFCACLFQVSRGFGRV